jgi:hypothetical protein
MRAKEFIIKEAKDAAGATGHNPDHISALPDAHFWPELDNSSGYLAYRFGVAMAGMPDQKMKVAGPTGLKMVTIGYTQAERDILDATQNLMGTPKVRLSSGKSEEMPDVYTLSPVNDWQKALEQSTKKKKSK